MKNYADNLIAKIAFDYTSRNAKSMPTQKSHFAKTFGVIGFNLKKDMLEIKAEQEKNKIAKGEISRIKIWESKRKNCGTEIIAEIREEKKQMAKTICDFRNSEENNILRKTKLLIRNQRRPKLSLFELSEKSREMCLMQMKINHLNEKVQFFEEKTIEKENRLRKIEGGLNDDLIYFDRFLEESKNGTNEQIRNAQMEILLKNEVIESLKRISEIKTTRQNNNAISLDRIVQLFFYKSFHDDISKYKLPIAEKQTRNNRTSEIRKTESGKTGGIEPTQNHLNSNFFMNKKFILEKDRQGSTRQEHPLSCKTNFVKPGNEIGQPKSGNGRSSFLVDIVMADRKSFDNLIKKSTIGQTPLGKRDPSNESNSGLRGSCRRGSKAINSSFLRNMDSGQVKPNADDSIEDKQATIELEIISNSLDDLVAQFMIKLSPEVIKFIKSRIDERDLGNPESVEQGLDSEELVKVYSHLETQNLDLLSKTGKIESKVEKLEDKFDQMKSTFEIEHRRLIAKRNQLADLLRDSNDRYVLSLESGGKPDEECRQNLTVLRKSVLEMDKAWLAKSGESDPMRVLRHFESEYLLLLKDLSQIDGDKIQHFQRIIFNEKKLEQNEKIMAETVNMRKTQHKNKTTFFSKTFVGRNHFYRTFLKEKDKVKNRKSDLIG